MEYAPPKTDEQEKIPRKSPTGDEIIPVAVIDEDITLVVEGIFQQNDGVKEGSTHYNNIKLDVKSFNGFYRNEDVPLVDVLYFKFKASDFVKGVIVTNETVWDAYQENNQDYISDATYNLMAQLPVIVLNSQNKEHLDVYLKDSPIKQSVSRKDLKETIFEAFTYAHIGNSSEF